MTNTEPQGVKDLREAKADYLASLSKLREADAEKVKAEATLVQAQAATEQARAALVQAAAKAKEIENDYTAAENAIALDTAKAAAEVFLAQQELALAEAEEDLRAYLVKVEEQSKQLTPKEQEIVWQYKVAYNAFLDAQQRVRAKQAALYKVTYNDYGVNNVEAEKAGYESVIAIQTANIARAQAKYDEYSEMAEEEIAKYDVWAAEVKALEDSACCLEYVLADIYKAEALAKLEYAEAFGDFFTELEKAQKDVDKKVSAATSDFELDEEYTLPTTGVKAVVTPFTKYVNNAGFSSVASFEVVDGKLVANATDPEATAKNIFGDEDNPDNYSLAGIIDALKRDSVVVDKIINDTTGLSSAVAKVKKDYADTKKVLEAGIDKYKPYVDAKAAYTTTKAEADQKVKEAAETIDYLLKAIKGAQKEQSGNTWKLEKAQQDSIENGIINFGKAIYAYFGKVERDSVETYAFNSKTGKSVKKTVALKDLTKDDFTPFAVDDDTYRTVFQNTADVPAFANSNSARYWAYNEVLKLMNGITSDIVKYSSDSFTIRDFDDETVAKWGIIPRPAGKDYYYDKNAKLFKHDVNDAFEYGKLAEKEAKVTAKHDEFYTEVYEKFWNVSFNPDDSLKINFSEKTFTDPYVIPVFAAKDVETPVYNPKDSSFNFDNLKYNDEDSELEIIEEKLGKNYISINEDGKYTLYAQSLAAAQIASMVEDYKENTKALAALEEVVATVEADYLATLLNLAEAKVVADSVVTAYLGEDIVKAKLAGTKKTATDIWNNPTEKAKLVVDCVTPNFDSDNFVSDAGKYNLGGKQLAAAEKHIPDYAAFVAKNRATRKEIQAAQDGCAALTKIINEYAREIAKLDKNFRWGDSETIDAFVRAKWAWLLASIEQEIKDAQTAIAEAEGSLAKLEAGFDGTQIKIEIAEKELAQAVEALEVAEAKLAIAEEAYKAVLEAHGITE